MLIKQARQALFEYEEAYAGEHHELPATLFISAGTLEESMLVPVRGVPARFVTNVRDMASKLYDKDYENLALTHYVFEDENYFSGGPGAISRGLRVVFSS